MRNYILSIVVLLCGFSVVTYFRNRVENITDKDITNTKIQQDSTITINKTILYSFFKKYPDLKNYQSDVISLYKKRNYHSIWYYDKKLIEFANLLYAKVNLLEEEGLKASLVYKDKIDGIFSTNTTDELSQTETEIMLSSIYVFYAKNVFHGIDTKKTTETGWFLPRKSLSYETLLDSLLVDPKLLTKNENHQLGQYYKLREALKKYRQIEKNDDWKPIEIDFLVRSYNPNDSSKTIGQIRHRLFVMGDLEQDSKSNKYDADLMVGVLNFKKRNGYKENYLISNWNIERMNVPINTYISTIIVNMERCRWINPELIKANEYIFINIPSYKLIYKKNGVKEFESKIFVGETMNKTVVFSSNMSSIVFSPYWNIPKSIVGNELQQAIVRDPNYLVNHNIEWNNGNPRQKPGPKNSLGLVKFVFPNTNDIYLHDTPVKSIFNLEYRAFSHGCINMDKAKELAMLILKDDPDWPVERINEAIKGEKETICILKNQIPVYIGYFTAWVNEDGTIHFYEDVYHRDKQLASLLFME